MIPVATDLKALSNPKTPLELARRLYEQSPLPVARIAEIIGIHRSTLYGIAKREGWRPRNVSILHGNDHRFRRRFQFADAAASTKGLTNAEIARAFASRSPEELAAEREEIVRSLWETAQAEIAKVNESKKRRQDMGDILLASRTIESLLRMRKQLQGSEAPEAVRSRDEIGASILALLDEMEGEREGKAGPSESRPSSAKGVDHRDSARQDAD